MAQSIGEKARIRQGREEGRATEDDIALARLGPRGEERAPDTAKMTQDSAEQTPPALADPQGEIFFALPIVAPDDAVAGSPSASSNAASSCSLPQSFKISANLERVLSERTHPRGGLTGMAPFQDRSHIARWEKCGASLPLFAPATVLLVTNVSRCIASSRAACTFSGPPQIDAASS